MLVIRLQRTGKRNSPTFRVVVAEKARSAKKEFHEVVGHYLPTRDPAEFECKQDRIIHWISQGAQPSDTVARLLVKDGVKEAEKFISRYSKKKPKKEPPEEAAPPPPPAAETPAEEAKEEAPAEESAAPEAEAPAEEPKEEAPKDEESAPEQGNDENEGDNENKDS